MKEVKVNIWRVESAEVKDRELRLPGFYFQDERNYLHGPYSTQQRAEESLEAYCDYYLGHGKYYLDCDGDGHWYVVSVDRRADFQKWLADNENMDCPAYFFPIGGNPSQIIFQSWKLDDDRRSL